MELFLRKWGTPLPVPRLQLAVCDDTGRYCWVYFHIRASDTTEKRLIVDQ